MEEYDYCYNIILLGSYVGKTSILNRYIKNAFINEYYTYYVEYMEKIIYLDNGERIMLRIGDTCGQELYWSVTRSYLKHAHGLLLIYDVTDKSSLDDLYYYWLDETKEPVPKDIPKIVVGNHIDDEDNRQVTKEQGEEFAKEFGLLYYECSA